MKFLLNRYPGLYVLVLRIKEDRGLQNLLLGLLWLYSWLGYALRRDPKRKFLAYTQVHRSSTAPWLRTRVEPFVVNHLPLSNQIMAKPLTDCQIGYVKDCIGNRIMVLKAPVSATEKGILLIKFSETMEAFERAFDMPKLLEQYQLVLEPSWAGLCDIIYFQYLKYEQDVFVFCADTEDRAFIKRLNSHLIPFDFGAFDWVLPSIAEPYLDKPKKYDIVMVSSFGSWKRHHALFHALTQMPKDIQVVLVGAAYGGIDRQDLLHLADYYGVTEQLHIYEKVPYAQVMELCCQARVSVLMSLKEGSNKALAESIFCDLPVLVYESHIGGSTRNVVAETGLQVNEGNLAAQLQTLLANAEAYQARQWGLANISCFRSTERLNQLLKAHNQAQGLSWTQDIAVRSNAPDPIYVQGPEKQVLAPYNEALKQYLRV